ncbi:C1 family peptidase [Fischerella sp. JS2]|uniref:C1 family peptidase n=1 Tax=Fischerella sp. JS2 TaxID=2597771 RepID=UPI0028E23AE3|nr:C1 family peptidase [Fischerella sp. JS2]
MADKAKQQKSNTDITKKGLGWVPDYPDLRDYNSNKENSLKDELRLKIEERTGNFENIIKGLLSLLIEIQRNEKEDKNHIKLKIDAITNQIFGGILFAKIRVHRLLRDEWKQDQNNAKHTLNKIPYESILLKQVVELKKYLGVLLIGDYLSPSKEVKDRQNNLVDFTQPAQVVNWIAGWMRNETYDPIAKDLVKQFQLLTKIKEDGIVGLETYTTLNEYFSDYKKLSQLQQSYRDYKDKGQNQNQQKTLSKIRFFSVTSLIPSQAIDKIIETLIFKSAHQICQEYSTPNQRSFRQIYESIFEDEFLKNIEVEEKVFQPVKDIRKEYFKNKYVDSEQSLIKNMSIIINLKNQNYNSFLPQFSDIVEVVQNSYVIEPVISFILQNISPLANWKNLSFEELIEQGFSILENVLIQEEQSKTYNLELGCSKKELAKNAIAKTISLLRLEIYSLAEQRRNIILILTSYILIITKSKLSEKNKINKILYIIQQQINAFVEQEFIEIDINTIIKKHVSSIVFYFLLKKYLNFVNKNRKMTNIYEEGEANIFDKQEVFEIDQLVNYDNFSLLPKDVSREEKLKLFPTLDLEIPIVNNSFIKELNLYKQKNIKNNKKPFFLIPSVIDLSYWFSPIRDQGSLNSCTAFAAIALLEYLENRNFGKFIDASPLFLYKAARNKMNVQGDVGASIRETMKVLALFGVPPEEAWPYEEDQVDEEPPPYCYAYAQNYQSLKYFLLDYAGITTESLLFQIKAVLAAGFPCIFGFTMYSSAYDNSNYNQGWIAYPNPQKDKVIGGHTVVAVGYDDYKFIQCSDRRYYSKGAFLIRNSWGTEWGVEGYGWLPYDYVLAGLTAAWWSLLKAEWFDESNFGRSGTGGGPPGTGQGGESGTGR